MFAMQQQVDGGFENVQPLLFHSQTGSLALAHNGNLINANQLKSQLRSTRKYFSNKHQIQKYLAHLIKRSGYLAFKDQVKNALINVKRCLCICYHDRR